MSQARYSSRAGVAEAQETLAAQCMLRGDLPCSDKAVEEVVYTLTFKLERSKIYNSRRKSEEMN